MSKKKVDKHPVVHEVTQTARPRKHQNHEQKQKDKGEVVVKWIFGVLFALSILYIIWSMYIA